MEQVSQKDKKRKMKDYLALIDQWKGMGTALNEHCFRHCSVVVGKDVIVDYGLQQSRYTVRIWLDLQSLVSSQQIVL